jgi:pimeloyl-ACP methyl ester carboxylesterase
MDHTVWALIGRALAHHGVSLLAPDLPGHSHSEGPAPTSVEDYAAWIGRLIDATEFPSAHLAGHSMGSLASLELAATRPELVTSLIMLGTAAAMPVHPELQAAADEGRHLAVELINSWSFASESHLGRHPTPGLTLRDGGIKLMERIDPRVIASDLRASAAYTGALGAASHVTCPSLLLLGEDDLMTPPHNAEPLVKALGATTVTLAKTGHMMMLERPHEVIDTMMEFLGTA